MASLVAGARVEEFGRRYGICTSLLYWWRGAVPGQRSPPAVRLVPVRVARARQAESRAVSRCGREFKRLGLGEIALNHGMRVRVDADVSSLALRQMVTALPRGSRLRSACGFC